MSRRGQRSPRARGFTASDTAALLPRGPNPLAPCPDTLQGPHTSLCHTVSRHRNCEDATELKGCGTLRMRTELCGCGTWSRSVQRGLTANCVSGARGFSEPAPQRPSARFMPTTQHALTLRRPPRPRPPRPRPPRPRPPRPRPPRPRPHPPGTGATRSRSG